MTAKDVLTNERIFTTTSFLASQGAGGYSNPYAGEWRISASQVFWIYVKSGRTVSLQTDDVNEGRRKGGIREA